MESAAKRKKREEERKKREEQKKAELAKYFGAGTANKMRRGSADSQAALTGAMEPQGKDDELSASRTSSRSEHSSSSNKSSLKQPGSTSQISARGGSSKSVQIKDEPQVRATHHHFTLVYFIHQICYFIDMLLVISRKKIKLILEKFCQIAKTFLHFVYYLALPIPIFHTTVFKLCLLFEILQKIASI